MRGMYTACIVFIREATAPCSALHDDMLIYESDPGSSAFTEIWACRCGRVWGKRGNDYE